MAETEDIRPRQPFSGQFQSTAARQQHGGVKPQQSRNAHWHPVRSTLAHKKCAGERHEKHQNCNDANGNSGVIPAWRNWLIGLLLAFVSPTAILAGWRLRAPTASTLFLDDEFDFLCSRSRHASL